MSKSAKMALPEIDLIRHWTFGHKEGSWQVQLPLGASMALEPPRSGLEHRQYLLPQLRDLEITGGFFKFWDYVPHGDPSSRSRTVFVNTLTL